MGRGGQNGSHLVGRATDTVNVTLASHPGSATPACSVLDRSIGFSHFGDRATLGA